MVNAALYRGREQDAPVTFFAQNLEIRPLVYPSSNGTGHNTRLDGTLQGNLAELGVYAFYIVATFAGGKQDLLRCNVTLLR